MQTLELLAPAKNLECGRAAIDHGADAVYIGPPTHGARQAAGNSIDDIAELCRYAHQFGARVYATVNTIVYDNELSALSPSPLGEKEGALSTLKSIGVDAVLVQDMAVLEACRELGIAVHASTQTDNRTAGKVAWLAAQGCERVVLARELSIDEIRKIHAEVPNVELEAFVHGALCVSYSGQCYASQHCFGRSANRGECAQFCRLPFSLVDKSGRTIVKDRYLLSLKDLCRVENLEEMAAAGVCSFKIEGRLKGVEYVKNTVAAYHLALNRLVKKHPERYCRASRGEVRLFFEPDLARTFNRGYTTYGLHGRKEPVWNPFTPKAIGQPVGRVKEVRRDSIVVSSTAAFSNGDGLCYFDRDHQLHGFRVNRAEGNRLYIQHSALNTKHSTLNIPPSTPLYRNQDMAFERLLGGKTAERQIPLTLKLEALPDDGFATGFSLSLDDGERRACVAIHAEHQLAQKPQRETIVRELSKLGGTPFVAREVLINEPFPYFIPASRLSELRRFGVERLLKAPLQPPPRGERPVSRAPLPFREGEDGYLLNIANQRARAFYVAQGVQNPALAYELQPVRGARLMQCRHCIRYSLGHCLKHGGTRPDWQEPLSLVSADGRRFRLEFDCKHCQMNVFAEPNDQT